MDTILMFTKLFLKFTHDNRKKKRSQHGKCEKNERFCSIIFWWWRWNPTEIVDRKITVRQVHAVAAALIAVAIKGTSTENIPFPR